MNSGHNHRRQLDVPCIPWWFGADVSSEELTSISLASILEREDLETLWRIGQHGQTRIYYDAGIR